MVGEARRLDLSNPAYLGRISAEWLGNLSTAETMDELTTAYSRIASSLGFGYHSYVALEHIARAGEPLPFFVSTLPDEFIATYNAARFLSVDPVPRMAFNYNAPFGWYDCREYQQARRYSRGRKTKAREILELAHTYDLYNGLIIPTHTPNPAGSRRSRSSFISLYWTDGKAVDDDGLAGWKAVPGMQMTLHAFNAVTLYYHQRMMGFRQEKIDGDSEPTVGASDIRETQPQRPDANMDQETMNKLNLSERELDCLHWVAKGKTAEEAGQIIGISTHSVNSYLKAATEKLGAARTVQAVAVAIGEGLIMH